MRNTQKLAMVILTLAWAALVVPMAPGDALALVGVHRSGTPVTPPKPAPKPKPVIPAECKNTSGNVTVGEKKATNCRCRDASGAVKQQYACKDRAAQPNANPPVAAKSAKDLCELEMYHPGLECTFEAPKQASIFELDGDAGFGF